MKVTTKIEPPPNSRPRPLWHIVMEREQKMLAFICGMAEKGDSLTWGDLDKAFIEFGYDIDLKFMPKETEKASVKQKKVAAKKTPRKRRKPAPAKS